MQVANRNKVFTTLGASNHSKGERQRLDYYATDPLAASLLLELEDFENVLEPACGEGHLANVFLKKGIPVHCSDIADRGYGNVKNFFEYDSWSGQIVTNPPYKIAKEFVEHSLRIVPKGEKVAMFLKLQFLEGKARKIFFKHNPPKRIYISSSRILCAKNGDFEAIKKSGGSAVAYCWFIWEKGFKGKPEISWFN